MLKIRLKMPVRLQILFLLLFSFFIFPKVAAAQNGLINAMSFDEAEEIAVKSIRRASGIRVKKINFRDDMNYSRLSEQIKKDRYLRNCLSPAELAEIHKKGAKNSGAADDPVPNISGLQIRMNDNCFPQKRLRLTDTLDFLGITDDFRLAALRAYIVRNVEFGVQNIWGIDANGTAQSFVISGKQLEDVKTSTTVIDLAKKIQTSAALPFLPYSTAEMLVRNCRYKVTGDNTKPVPVSRNINADITDANKTAFKQCLDEDVFTIQAINSNNAVRSVDYKYGVRSIRIVNNEGDEKFYYLTDVFKKNLDDTIEKRNYKFLIEELVKSSGVSSSDEFLAAQIVINALLKIETELITTEFTDKNLVPPATVQVTRPFKNIRVSRMMFQIYDYNCSTAQKNLLKKVSAKNDLNSICVDAAGLTEKIKEQPGLKNYFILVEGKKTADSQEKVLVKLDKVSPANPLKNSMTIEQVIRQVSISIGNRRQELEKAAKNG